ncbi:MAG: hypothetical protein ACI4UE_05715 [Candidatus Scatovivens sp.]
MDIEKLIKKYTDEKLLSYSIDLDHIEKVFTNEKYYKAMKRVPTLEKKVLYLIAVEEYKPSEVAYLLNKRTEQIRKLKKRAIKHFKKNLERGADNNEQ